MYFGFEGLTVAYGRHVIWQDLTLDIPRGQISVLIGPNGCGKSTLLGTVSRAVTPRAGRVVLDGRPLDVYSPRERARRIAYLPQTQAVPDDLDVRTLVSYGRYPYAALGRGETADDREAIDRALTLTGMDAYRTRPLHTLSGGERQRARLALCLAQGADILLLDEPTTHLDVGHALELCELVCRLHREEELTVLMVLHDLNLAARYADRLIAVRDGRVCAVGTPDEVLTPQTVREVFDLEADVLRDETAQCPYLVPKTLTWRRLP